MQREIKKHKRFALAVKLETTHKPPKPLTNHPQSSHKLTKLPTK